MYRLLDLKTKIVMIESVKLRSLLSKRMTSKTLRKGFFVMDRYKI